MDILTDNKKLARLFLFLSVTPLFAALISQYVFGLHPCQLCIYQRIPYAVIIFFSVLALLFPSGRSTLILIVISAHAFLANAGIAFYHIGVEKHWWVHGDCSGNFDMTSVETLKRSLFEAVAVRCDDIQFQFLGLSMAGWNFVYCLFLSIGSAYILIKYLKRK